MAAFARKINVDMEWLDKGSFEIHGTLDDNVHSLDARLTIGFPDFTIREARAEITRMPYPGFCVGAVHALSNLVGERIGRGFRRRAGEVLGGAESCNHLHTLVNDMAACAFQMNYVAAKQRPDAAEAMSAVKDDHRLRRQLVLTWMPNLRNSCYLFSEKSDPLFENQDSKQPDSKSGDD